MLRLLALLLLPLAAACATTAADPAPAFSSDRISVQVQGSGPDVVLIPGLSSHPDVWRDTVAAVPGMMALRPVSTNLPSAALPWYRSSRTRSPNLGSSVSTAPPPPGALIVFVELKEKQLTLPTDPAGRPPNEAPAA